MKPFEILMLHGRPAAGKSETIDFLKKTPHIDRLKNFHVGDFKVLDDFPILWNWFEQDEILAQMGHEKLHTIDGFFKHPYQWDLLVRKLNLEYKKQLGENPPETTIIEFSRGTQHGGYQRAYEHMSDEVLSKCAIIYVEVSFDASMMKNSRRKNPEKLHSILEHSVDEEKLKYLYEHDDFRDFTANDPDYITIKGHKVPFVIFDNHDDVTTKAGKPMYNRLSEKLKKLHKLLNNK